MHMTSASTLHQHRRRAVRGSSLDAAPSSGAGSALPVGAFGHRDFVRSLVRRFGVPSADVDDAAQDVFMVLSRRQIDFREHGEQRGWLYVAARFVSLNRVRTWRREARRRCCAIADMDGLTDAAALGPEDSLILRQSDAAVRHALESLSAEQREVVILTDIEGHTAAEVAKLVHVPTATVSSRLRLGRQALRRLLSRTPRCYIDD